MRFLFAVALLLLTFSAHAQNYLSPAECMELAGDLDSFARQHKRASPAEKEAIQEQYSLRSKGFKKLCLDVYWCGEAYQANAKTNTEQMEAMNRYCPHKQPQPDAASWKKCKESAIVLDMASAFCMGEDKGKPACTESERAKREALFTKHCVPQYACAVARSLWKREDGFLSYVELINQHCKPEGK